jgi:beta-alanine--pyruvate transaminase
LFARGRELEPVLEEAIHSLRGEPNVIDIRNFGLAAAVELEPRGDAPGTRAMEIFHKCYDNGVMIRYGGDVLAIGPPLTVSEDQMGVIVETMRDAIRSTA